MKLLDEEAKVPFDMEIAYIPYERGAPYPGIFLYTQVRFLRLDWADAVHENFLGQ